MKKFYEKKKINFIKCISYDDYTDDLKLISDICGEEVVKKLLENLAGMYFYVPKITSFKNVIYRIINEYGKDYSNKELSKMLDVSEQYIRNAKYQMRKKKKTLANMNIISPQN